MKLFVSYARVDKPLCKQVVERLNDVHEVWYDRRLHAGQDWWREIQERLEWCEGFVYLLSPESVSSEYCQKEYDIARAVGKHIFPVLIQARTEIPDSLSRVHYADLSEGMEDIYTLMNAITIAERRQRKPAPKPQSAPTKPKQPPQTASPSQALGKAADAIETGNFDKAVFVVKQALEKKPGGRIKRMLESLLGDAEVALEHQTYLREAEREYAPIRELVQRESTRALGCEEWTDFQDDFPDYDPQNLSEQCGDHSVAPVSVQTHAKGKVADKKLPDEDNSQKNIWIGAFVVIFLLMAIGAGITLSTSTLTDIPTANTTSDPLELALARARAGVTSNAEWQAWYPEGFVREFDGVEMVLVPTGCFLMGSDAPQADNDEQPEHERCIQEPFWIDRYEVSQAQFAAFGGEAERESCFTGENLPRECVSWYEARDFCELRERNTTDDVRLPTEKEWEYAARGLDNLVYPWGNEWEGNLVNSNNDTGVDDYENTAPVTAFPAGASWVGAEQMSGNVWEWVSSLYEPYPYDATDGRELLDGTERRVLRGGSWRVNDLAYFRAAVRTWFNPAGTLDDFGFRCARLYT